MFRLPDEPGGVLPNTPEESVQLHALRERAYSRERIATRDLEALTLSKALRFMQSDAAALQVRGIEMVKRVLEMRHQSEVAVLKHEHKLSEIGAKARRMRREAKKAAALPPSPVQVPERAQLRALGSGEV